MIDWSKGYTTSFFATYVDPLTWRDKGRFELLQASISVSEDNLRQSASFDCRELVPSREYWIRLYGIFQQNGNVERYALFTGLAQTPKASIEGEHVTIPVDCFSVLKPANDVLLQRGWYAPEGFSGGKLIQKLLKVTNIRVEMEDDSPTLSQHIIAEDGETNLTMVDKILDAMGWTLWITGDGRVILGPTSEEPIAQFGEDYDILQPSIEVEFDGFDCPNVFRAINDQMTAIAKDESESSPFSISNRGREIWAEESSADLNEDETLSEYALRRLRELQTYGSTASYSRRFIPEIGVGDVVYINYPSSDERKNLVGLYKITSQSIDLDTGMPVSETVSRIYGA